MDDNPADFDQLFREAAREATRAAVTLDPGDAIERGAKRRRIVRLRRQAFAGLIVLLVIAAIVVPLPQLHLLHHPTTPPTKSPKVPKRPVTVSKTIEPTPNPTGPQNSSLAGLSCTSATACTAVGSYTNSARTSLTLAEAWNGTKWVIEPTPNPNGATGSPPKGATEASLAGVSCISSTACTAVGSSINSAGSSVVLAEAWNGRKWTIEPTPNPTVEQNDYLSGVSCTSASACTAVGSYANGTNITNSSSSVTYFALAEAWNGRKWAIEPTPSLSGSLSAVSCTSAAACTAVGSGAGGPLAEAWNGTKWVIEPTPNPTVGRNNSLLGVSCTSASECTAVGGYYTNSPDDPVGATLAEAWNGIKWTIEPTPNPTGAPQYGSLSSVSCTSAAACTAVGEPRPEIRVAPVTLAEAWNGTKWVIEPTPNRTASFESSLSGVSCTSATECTAVGSYQGDRTLGEVSKGKTWAIEPTPNATAALDSSLSSVSCTSATACTAVGNYTGGTLAERWNGETWAMEPTPNLTGVQAGSRPSLLDLNYFLKGVSCTSATACTAVGTGPGGTLAEGWNGRTWAIEAAPIPPGATQYGSLSAVSCTSATACTAVGSWLGGTLAEAWNGQKWAIEPTPSPSKSSSLFAVSCTSATACTAVGSYQSTDKAKTTRTLAEAWNGKRWAIEPTRNSNGANSNGLDGVSCTSTTACTAVGSYVWAPPGEVPAGAPPNSINPMTLLETWNGKRWAMESTPNPDGFQETDVSGVSCTSAGACTAVGDYFDDPANDYGRTLAYAWNGQKWAFGTTPDAGDGQNNSLSGVSCTSATTCVAVGAAGEATLAERVR